MNHPQHPDPPVSPGERIAALQSRGAINREQAAALGDAIESSRAAAVPAPAAAQDAGGLYLSGQISEAELRRRGLLCGVALAVLFGGLMAVFQLINNPSGWMVSVQVHLLSGILFGWLMHRFLIRKVVNQHVALLKASGGEPLEPVAAVDAGQCPQCRSEAHTTMGPRDWGMLHWQLNPGLAVNELLLGQRIPMFMNTCSDCGTGAVDCQRCNRAIHGSHWSRRNAFFHWGSLRCPHCESNLPTLSNWLAAVVRAPFRLGGLVLSKLGVKL